MHRNLLCAIAALALGGCAALEEIRGMSPTAWGVEDQLVFLDRLGAASPEELGTIGERLQADAGAEGKRRTPVDALRYALWQSTPGHDDYAPAAARQRLKGLLENGHPPHELQALMRVQLRHLRHVQIEAALREKNAALSADNGRLQAEIKGLNQQIQELTTLERRMGSDAGGDSE